MDPSVVSNVEAFYASFYPTRGLKLEKSESKGRFLVALRDFSTGSEVLSDEPYASVIDAEHSLTHCGHCFLLPAQNLSRCGRCKEVRYCSVSCQVRVCPALF